MKSLPRWGISLIILGTICSVLLMTQQFAEKSLVYAEGEVALSSDLIESAKGLRTLFIVVYDEDSPMPMPYGAIKYSLSSDATGAFKSFVLTKDNLQIMNPNAAKLPKRLRIKARLDKNGQGGMDQAGDLIGDLKGVALGQSGLKIILSKEVK